MFFAILFRWCFYLINDKNLFRSTWSVTFAKIFSYFNILTISTIFNLEYFSLFSLLESIYVHDYILTGLILIMLWYVLLYLLHYHLIYQYTQLLFFNSRFFNNFLRQPFKFPRWNIIFTTNPFNISIEWLKH